MLYMQKREVLSHTRHLINFGSEIAVMFVMKPKEDVCGKCSDLQSVIVRARTENA